MSFIVTVKVANSDDNLSEENFVGESCFINETAKASRVAAKEFMKTKAAQGYWTEAFNDEGELIGSFGPDSKSKEVIFF